MPTAVTRSRACPRAGVLGRSTCSTRRSRGPYKRTAVILDEAIIGIYPDVDMFGFARRHDYHNCPGLSTFCNNCIFAHSLHSICLYGTLTLTSLLFPHPTRHGIHLVV